MVACSLLDAPGKTPSKAPVGGSCREEETHFSNPYSNLFTVHLHIKKVRIISAA